MLIVSTEDGVRIWCGKIRETWETSEPEWVTDEKSTRFLGMELSREASGAWRAVQANYTTDLLQRNLGRDRSKWQVRKVPMVKEGMVESDAESDEKSDAEPCDIMEGDMLEAVRNAQKAVGEVNWLVTRCRPDLMYVVSKMASYCARKPAKTLQMAAHLWKYLVGTEGHGLRFECSEEMELTVYTDASYGAEPHGCVILFWGESPILWRSTKQSLITTSTAAAEMLELMEGAVMTEAIRVVIEEILGHRVRTWQLTDSSAALAIAVGDTASWKTRHLRKRARYLRWKIGKGDVALRHCPGLTMVADLGTKPLAAVRLQELKKLLGMHMPEMIKETEEKKPKDDQRAMKVVSPHGGQLEEQTRKIQVAILMLALAQAAAAESDGDSDEAQQESVLFLYTLVVMVASGVISWVLRGCWDAWRGGLRVSRDEPSGSLRVRDGERTAGDGGDLSGQEKLQLHRSQKPYDGELVEPTAEEIREWEETVTSDRPRGSSETQSLQSPLGMRFVYVTPQGRRYHLEMLCDGLRNAKVRRQVRVCDECWGLARSRPGSKLCISSNLMVAHAVGSQCECSLGRMGLGRVFGPCRVCAMKGV